MVTHKCAWCPASYSTAVEVNRHQMGCPYTPDHRDAEIARLRVALAALRVTADEAIVEHLVARKEVERLREYERLHGTRSNEIGKLRAALAAGPAALRDIIGEPDTNDREVYEHACGEVEAAQRRVLDQGEGRWSVTDDDAEISALRARLAEVERERDALDKHYLSLLDTSRKIIDELRTRITLTPIPKPKGVG